MDIVAEEIKYWFERIHRKHEYSLLPKWRECQEELKKAGYKIEHAWGYYLHCPDGTTITLDWWNEEQDEG